MFSSFLSGLRKKNKLSLKVPNSILVNRLQEYTQKNSLYIIKDAKIFNHSEMMDIPLMIIDPKRGLYLFEYKTWAYKNIKDLKASKSSHEQVSENTLAFESKHDFIERRFGEILHCEEPDIHNFVLMEYLTKEEFERLDPSFSELLPANRILFSSDEINEIENKLFDIVKKRTDTFTIEQSVATLFIQKCVLHNGKVHITSKEQDEIITYDFSGTNYISCNFAAGSTTVILLKALYEHLTHKEKNICVVQPTLLACELFQQRLLATVEYGIVDVDFSKISVVTPKDIKKKADMLLIDNASLLDKELLNDASLLKKELLIFENFDEYRTYRFSLNHNYRENAELETLYGNPYALTFVNLQRLLDAGVPLQNILIVTTGNDEKENIVEDLESFISGIPVLLDPFQTLNNQDLDHLLIAQYQEIFGISRDYVFIFNPKDISEETVNFLLSRANKKTFVIYEEKGDMDEPEDIQE